MFTGLVQHLGVVRSVESAPAGTRLVLDATGWTHAPEPGESIAVSGVCLTVAQAAPGPVLGFDVVPETLSRTTLGGLGEGSRVNLEHAATPTTLLGGHIVQGHVDGLATVIRVEREREHRIRLGPPAELMPFIVPKGSVCLDGVSLTVAALDPKDLEGPWFEVALIPTTLERTTLSGLRPGSRVNLEADCLAKALIHYVRNYAGDR